MPVHGKVHELGVTVAVPVAPTIFVRLQGVWPLASAPHLKGLPGAWTQVSPPPEIVRLLGLVVFVQPATKQCRADPIVPPLGNPSVKLGPPPILVVGVPSGTNFGCTGLSKLSIIPLVA